MPSGLRQISGTQSVRGKRLRLRPGHSAAPLDDQIDRLRRERLFLHRLPTVDRPEDWPLLDVGPAPAIRAAPRPEGRPEAPCPPRRRRRSWSGRVGLRGMARSVSRVARIGRAGGSFLSCSTLSRAISLRRRPPDAKAKRRIARSRESAKRSVAQVAISRSRTSRVTARLLLRWAATAKRERPIAALSVELGAANGPSMPFQRCNVLQLARRRLTVFGAWEPSQRSKPSRRKLSATSVRYRSRAWRDPRDDAPRISARAPRSPATAAAWPAAAPAQASK